MVGGDLFHLLHDLFCFMFLYRKHLPSQFVLKLEHFHYVSVENHMWKYGQEVFFFLLNLHGTQTSHNQVCARRVNYGRLPGKATVNKGD